MKYFGHMKRLASLSPGKRNQSHNAAMKPTMLTLLVALASWIVSLVEAGAFR